MSKEAIDELKRLRSILSGITGLEDDDQEYIEDARKSVDRIIEALAEQPAQHEPDRVKFERHWRKTRGDKKANRELPRHPLQPQTYIQDSANRHWVTWQAAVRSVAPPAQRKPLTDEELRVIENKINPNMRWRSSDEEGITFYPIEYYELVRAIEAAHGIKGDA